MNNYELTFKDNQCVSLLVGEFGSHLKLLREAYGVDVHQRGLTLKVDKESPKADLVCDALQQLYGLIEDGEVIRLDEVRHCVGILQMDPDADLKAFFSDTVIVANRNRRITPRTVGQRLYLQSLRRFDMVFGVGPAGTGKTYLAVAVAAAALAKGDVERIILARPAVEAGEKLGYLPGDLNEKINPYLRPLFDALHDMLGRERTERLLETGEVEVVPMAFMRGRTLDRAYVILDEAQNTSVEQMKMFLTRMGVHSKVIVTGDETQVDLPRGIESGLGHCLKTLQHLERIGIFRFGIGDVVRHSLVGQIIEAYEASGESREFRGTNRGHR